MAGEGAFLVEDFLGAIASQLDRTQDALALKAVNRPLTYAIKDFTMELKVFVEMDQDGRVRFRSPAPNEAGASAVHIGFTTITRPMIEENTVELSLAQAPTLVEAGLSENERQRLERLGVRTTAELSRLGGTAGPSGLARLTGVPVDRLRAALAYGRPHVRAVRPARPSPPPPRAAPKPTPAPRPPASPPAQTTPAPAPPRPVPPRPVPPRPVPRRPVPRRPVPRPAPPVAAPPRFQEPPVAGPQRPAPPVHAPPVTRRLELVGRNLVGPRGAPTVRLAGLPLPVAEADEHRLVVELPEHEPPVGTLEVDHGDGAPITYELAADPWEPQEA